jgi:hypothetical protein
MASEMDVRPGRDGILAGAHLVMSSLGRHCQSQPAKALA